MAEVLILAFSFVVIHDDNIAGRCAEGQCFVMTFLISERVYSFEIHVWLCVMIKENTFVTSQGVWMVCTFLGSSEICSW
jgi:hypothetical protein